MTSYPRILGAAALLSCTAFAHADTGVDLRPQISVLYSHVFADSVRGDEDGQGVYLGGTWNFSPRWAAELGASWQRFDESLDRAGTPREWRDWGVNIDAQYYFSRNARFSPYAILGAGATRMEDRVNDTRSTDPFAQAGFGFRSQLTSHISLRGDALYRYTDVADGHGVDRSGFREPVVRLGLAFPIGRVAASPEVAPPPPAVEPTPAPRPPAPAPEPRAEVIFEFDEAIFFGFDSDRLRPEAEGRLLEAARLIQEDKRLRVVEVAGHTCDLGSAPYNQGLSERRARAVREFLISRGNVDPNLLTVQGYGLTQPKVPNDGPENRQQNRRVELRAAERH